MLLHLCPATGCRELIPVTQKYCERHAYLAEQQEAKRQRRYDTTVRLARDKQFHEFYLSKEWGLSKRQVTIRYHGLCLWAYYEMHLIAKADEVHHIIPLKDDWSRRHDPGNLIPLTHAAHMLVESLYRKNASEKAKTQKILFSLLKQWEAEYPRG